MAKKRKARRRAKRREISKKVASKTRHVANPKKTSSATKSAKKGDTQHMAEATGHQVSSDTGEETKKLDRLEERLKSLTSERGEIVKQLIEIRNRAGRLLAQAGHSVDEGRAPGTARRRGRPPQAAAPVTPAKRRGRPPKAAKAATGKKRGRPAGSKVKCKVCGTLGHNARGHAKWQAAQGKA